GLAVHEERADARGVLVGLVKGGLVAVALGIEDHDVRIISSLQVASLGQLEDVRRQTAGAADGPLQRNDLLLDAIAADFAREAAVAARMRHRVAGNLRAAVARRG